MNALSTSLCFQDRKQFFVTNTNSGLQWQRKWQCCWLVNSMDHTLYESFMQEWFKIFTWLPNKSVLWLHLGHKSSVFTKIELFSGCDSVHCFSISAFRLGYFWNRSSLHQESSNPSLISLAKRRVIYPNWRHPYSYQSWVTVQKTSL